MSKTGKYDVVPIEEPVELWAGVIREALVFFRAPLKIQIFRGALQR